jgi:Ulp1 family protease
MAQLIPDNTMNSFNYSKVSRWHKKILVTVKFLYVPIHVDYNHWILCRVDFSNKKIYLWNSSSRTLQNLIYLQAMKKYIQHVAKSVNAISNDINKKNQWNGEWIFYDKSMFSPQQGNYDDCGVFTILNMVLLMSQVEFELSEYSYSQFEITDRNTRHRIAQIIFKNIDWNDFVSNNIQDKKWLSFIHHMKNKFLPNSWNWVNKTVSL